MTLACEDGKQVEAHKVVLASSSPFFQNLLRRNKHPHPLIYMRGAKSDDLLVVVDFLYCGETNVYQENLDSFLAIAEELLLKGLVGKTDEDEVTEKEIFRTQNVPEKEKERPMYKREARDSRPANPPHQSNVTKQISSYHPDVFSGTVALTSQHSGELRVQDVLQGSDPMMEKTDRKMPNGKPVFNCKVCGKEDTKSNIRQHIENNHMEGISVPCKFCEKTFRSRHSLSQHNQSHHRNRKDYI